MYERKYKSYNSTQVPIEFGSSCLDLDETTKLSDPLASGTGRRLPKIIKSLIFNAFLPFCELPLLVKFGSRRLLKYIDSFLVVLLFSEISFHICFV